MEESKDR